jgi:hypothetical protein
MGFELIFKLEFSELGLENNYLTEIALILTWRCGIGGEAHQGRRSGWEVSWVPKIGDESRRFHSKNTIL